MKPHEAPNKPSDTSIRNILLALMCFALSACAVLLPYQHYDMPSGIKVKKSIAGIVESDVNDKFIKATLEYNDAFDRISQHLYPKCIPKELDLYVNNNEITSIICPGNIGASSSGGRGGGGGGTQTSGALMTIINDPTIKSDYKKAVEGVVKASDELPAEYSQKVFMCISDYEKCQKTVSYLTCGAALMICFAEQLIPFAGGSRGKSKK